jgi:hypothetical protein
MTDPATECPGMPGQPRCPEWLCDCFIDTHPDDPLGLHPEDFTVTYPTTDHDHRTEDCE